MTKELIEQAREAIDSMDDFARMANVVASGPLQVLSKAIDVLEQQSNQVEELVSAQATIAQIREALKDLRTAHVNIIRAFDEHECENPEELMEVVQADEILALPTNQDALHEALARECERLAKFCSDEIYGSFLYAEAAAHRARKEQK